MQDLYSEKDLLEIDAQLKKRYLLLGICLAVIIVLVVVSLVVRVEWLTVASVFLFCAVSIFVIDLFCLPLHRYKKLLQSALTGRNHTETLEYAGIEPELSRVDGVVCHGLLFLGEPDKHGIREQRFYWDAQRPLRGFMPGQMVTLKYTGRTIIGYQA